MISSQSWLDAQNSVIGSMLIDDQCVPIVMRETSERDFSGACLTIYRAIKKLFLASSPVDPVTVGNIVGDNYNKLLIQLMEITPTAANVGEYIKICREKSRTNILKEIAGRMAETDDLEALRKLLDEANTAALDRAASRARNLEDLLHEFYEDLSKPPDFLPWPIPVIRDHVRVSPGDFLVLGGDPSTGKTAWALQCAMYWARTKRVCYFSLETKDRTILNRLLSSWSRIDKTAILDRTLTPENYSALYAAGEEIAKQKIGKNFSILNAAGSTVADIRAQTVIGRYDLIIVDYMQLLRAEGRNSAEVISSISSGLHTMAQSLGVTVLAVSQLNRDTEGARADMARMKGSGQIEYDADAIMMMKLENPKVLNGTRILAFVKNKEGERFDLPLAFDGKTQLFTKGHRSIKTNVADVKKARRAASQAAPILEQLPLLPEDTPVPF